MRAASHRRPLTCLFALALAVAASTQVLADEGAEAEAMAAAPARDTGKIRPVKVIGRYNDMARDAVEASGRLSASEQARLAELIAEGDRLVVAIRQTAQRRHVEREASVARLHEIGDELLEIYNLALTDRRRGMPLVESRSAAGGWTMVGVDAGPLQVVRARFLRPGSAYLTLRNTGDAPAAYALGIQFTDIVGEVTGTAALASRMDEELRPGETREVLLQIVPAVDRFWDVTTDHEVSVR